MVQHGIKKTLFVALAFILGACRFPNGQLDTESSTGAPRDSESDSDLAAELPKLGPGNLRVGRYLGYFKIPERKISYPIVIDLVGYRLVKSVQKLRATVRIGHESFQSHEYSSQFIPFVDYFPKKQLLNFKNQVGLFALSDVAVNGTILQGSLTVMNPKVAGTFSVSWQPAGSASTAYLDMLNEFPTMGNLTGTYLGLCGQIPSELQIEVSRRSVEKPMTKAFDWDLAGRQMTGSRKGCARGTSECRAQAFKAGSYNIATGTVELTGDGGIISCQKGQAELKCGECIYTVQKATSTIGGEGGRYSAHPRDYHIFLADGSDPLAPTGEVVSHGGLYFGFLHHEGLGRYQALRLRIDETTKSVASGETWNFLGGVATLFFGDPQDKEFIVYNYQPRRFVASRPVFIFDGESETFLAISNWTDKGASGVWYSKTFGRVGTIELAKGTMPRISERASILPMLAGNYSGDRGTMQIRTKPQKSRIAHAFYPVAISGTFIDKDAHDAKSAIVGGSYDFYTGALRINLDDARRGFGRRVDGRAEIFWPPGASSLLHGLLKQKPAIFALEKKPPQFVNSSLLPVTQRGQKNKKSAGVLRKTSTR